ncbi:MmgE/PrpD family protein [Polaromonas hydrogenivorans]|uniref:MmgE/PrpD family protein n=1 Tax=Polaromonas hydrogenivorans TaxID=335476 RepID=A0AAU7LYF0_9BURK
MPTPADLSHDFASMVANTQYENLPASAIEGAKKSILDTIGVILGASGVEPSVRSVVELVREAGGNPESSVLGFGGRAPALMAAFANGAMAHCLDFDDHAPEGHHPSSSIVPAVFALAERAGGVSGREMIAAVAAGQEVFLRLRRNVESRKDWHLTTVLGVFSAAAAAARVLRLSPESVGDAFGYAGMQCCGTMEMMYSTGSSQRGLYAGFSTKGAVLAAMMAQKGISGVQTMFEGKAGLFNVYFGGKYNREGMVADLGKVYSGGEILYKPWPSCGVSHGFIHSTLTLMKEHKLTIDDIKELRVNVGDFGFELCTPIEDRRAPQTSADAKFSIPFCVAVAATHGWPKVEHFFGDGLKDPAVLAAAKKVVPVPDPAFDWNSKLPKGRLDIETVDGRTISMVGDEVPGDAECPMSWDYLYQKFEDTAKLAAVPASMEKMRKVQEMVRHLETLDDATEVLRVLG